MIIHYHTQQNAASKMIINYHPPSQQTRLITILSKPKLNLYTPPSSKIFGRIKTTTIRAPVKGASDFLGYW